MSLVQQVLAALSGSPTQNQRLLKLHTPLGENVLLAERLDGVEAIGPHADGAPAGLRFVVHALSVNAHLDLKQLIGQPVLLELLTQASRTRLRPWHGHVTQVAQVGSDGGLARYRLVVEPWLSFLAQRQDSWVFQRQTVMQIVDEVFADYAAAGKLAPAWRWDIADPAVYAQRSLCIQYQESDLTFVERLLREEGLFYWFEHEGAPADATLGRHTLVIADHNGAFKPNTQPVVRYTQAGSALDADSLVRWQRSHQLQAARVNLQSPDYRAGPQALALRPSSAMGVGAPLEMLSVTDQSGQYAYEDGHQGLRLARRQMEALDALREQAGGQGSWRSAAPASTFTLVDHPVHDGLDAQRDRFVVLAVQHQARNNLHADVQARLDSLLGTIRRAAHGPDRSLPNASDEPVYRCQLQAQRAATPVRRVALDAAGLPDPRIHPRPTVHGVQTAIVTGAGAPVHTDRDHRIRLQFHWQRGAQSSHRLQPPQGDNAPASDASGTWVRVAESLAGANWGSNFTPRVGQEVLVGFIGGDIDRPVVLGAVYNGVGQADAQNNQVSAGAAAASGDAPAWFPGNAAAGRLQGHRHAAVLSGYKSQELAASASGTGGHNQLVLDDSPGAGRLELSSTSAQTRLQLGHLLQQTDNRRLQPRGHGLDLATQAWGAVRAGAGLLVSAHGKPASIDGGMQMNLREPLAQVQLATELAHGLAEKAQLHQTLLPGELDTVGARKPDTARQLPFEKGLYSAQDSLSGSDEKQTDGSAGIEAIGGGLGRIPTLARPDLVLAAPGGIASHTPAHAVATAGHTASLVAGQDLHWLAQANTSLAVTKGLALFTNGQATLPGKPNQETGIQLHAATGSVSMQSQTAATRLTADKAVNVTSTHASVRVAAPKHILLTAMGAAIRIEGGNITLSAPGHVQFKAGMKELGGPASASPDLHALPSPGNLKNRIELNFHYDDLEPVAGAAYKVRFANGTQRSGKLDAQGHAELANVPPGTYTVEFGEDPQPWQPPPPDPHEHKDSALQAEARALIERERADREAHGADAA